MGERRRERETEQTGIEKTFFRISVKLKENIIFQIFTDSAASTLKHTHTLVFSKHEYLFIWLFYMMLSMLLQLLLVQHSHTHAHPQIRRNNAFFLLFSLTSTSSRYADDQKYFVATMKTDRQKV